MQLSRSYLSIILLSVCFIAGVWSHCQVPCGIYDDELRVRMLYEDMSTILKAIDEITSLTKKLEESSATVEQKSFYLQQITRWVNTKEHHASNMIDIVSNYFLLQRIPEDDTENILKAVKIMKLALKLKQSLDKQFTTQLKLSLDFFAVKYLPEPNGILALSSLESQQLVLQ